MRVSDRKKRSIRQKKKDTIETVEELIANLRQKQQEGKNLNTKELDSLKWGIKYIEDTEQEMVEKTAEEVLPEGKLKDYIENQVKLTKIVFGEDNKRSKLTKEVVDKIIDEMGYYSCVCGFIHEKDRECMFLEYSKFKEKDVNSEEESERDSIEDEVDV